jgi:N-hydroxyarylamine O-acetyltransferase
VAHLLSVPFENLSIHAGEPIVLDDDALFEKIVTKRRGGFCYELNGLFSALLRALGFDTSMLSACVKSSRGGFGPEFDHMVLLVKLKDPWLVDVGFGDLFREPLRLVPGVEQLQHGRAYRFEPAGNHRLILMQRDESGSWTPQYRFGLQPHVYADYEERCAYHQTSPDSHFTQKRVCSLMTEDGRVTLSDMRLITNRHSIREERDLATEREYAGILSRAFGIVMQNG